MGWLSETIVQIDEIEKTVKKHLHWVDMRHPVEPVPLESLIRRAYRTVMPEDGNGLTFSMDPAIYQIGFVNVNRLSMEQMLSNIFQNAIESIGRKGIREGKIHVTAEIEASLQHERVHIHIRDNGEGISPEAAERIFEKGFTTKPNRPPCLGLHWIRKALAAMNGTIEAENLGRGRGAAFHLTLPRDARVAR